MLQLSHVSRENHSDLPDVYPMVETVMEFLSNHLGYVHIV